MEHGGAELDAGWGVLQEGLVFLRESLRGCHDGQISYRPLCVSWLLPVPSSVAIPDRGLVDRNRIIISAHKCVGIEDVG